jgi:type III restriction enzyme
MANESYDAFVSSLQADMEEELGFKFGIIEKNMFKNIIPIPDNITDEKRIAKIQKQNSLKIFNDLKSNNYINQQGYPSEKLIDALENNSLEFSEDFMNIKEYIIDKIENRISRPIIQNNANGIKVECNSDKFKEFIKLWNIIKQKTNCVVDFDSEELITKSIEALSDINVSSPAIYMEKHFVDIKESGISGEELESLKRIKIENISSSLPNILEFLTTKTNLTRKTIAKILLGSNSLDEFKKNPTEYRDLSLKIIKNVLSKLMLNRIKYIKINDTYSQEMFNPLELFVYVKDDKFDDAKVVKSTRSIYNYIKCDSKPEVNFAKKLENDPEIVTYAKLPNQFKIETPIGKYNPDWAILTDKEGIKTMYFVIETKGTDDEFSLRFFEKGKIDCGKKHFNALGMNVVFEYVSNYDAFKRLMD